VLTPPPWKTHSVLGTILEVEAGPHLTLNLQPQNWEVHMSVAYILF
jgi:hypothetical protein